MTAAHYDCPACGGQLRAAGESCRVCIDCGEHVRERARAFLDGAPERVRRFYRRLQGGGGHA